MRRISFGLLCLLCGCVSGQLNFNTVDISSSLADLYTRQVLSNFSAYIDNPQVLPSMADLSAGTIQTSNTVTPSITGPFSHAITRGPTGAITSTMLSGASVSASASDSWQQNWNVVPVTDANTLRNLRGIYRYALYGTDLNSEYHVPRIITGRKLVADPYWLQLPQCIICKPTGYKGASYVNPKLKVGWMYWTSDPGSPAQPRLPPSDIALVHLGHYGSHELIMTADDFRAGYLSDFILFILPNTAPSAPTGAQGPAAGRRNQTPLPPALPSIISQPPQ